MTTDDTRPPDDECRHNLITTFREMMGGPARMWACADCQRRFYPACPACVVVGHRNEAHPATLDAERARHAALVEAAKNVCDAANDVLKGPTDYRLGRLDGATDILGAALDGEPR